MLEPEDESQNNGHFIIQTEKGCSSQRLLHEWKIRLEQEAIVIITNDTLPDFTSVPVGFSEQLPEAHLVVNAFRNLRPESLKDLLGPISGPILSGPSDIMIRVSSLMLYQFEGFGGTFTLQEGELISCRSRYLEVVEYKFNDRRIG